MLQEGTPSELYQRPRKVFVARFLGDMNLISATVERAEGGLVAVSTAAGTLRAANIEAGPRRGSVTLGFRPEDAVLKQEGTGRNGLSATVKARHYLGDSQLYQIDAAGTLMTIRAPKTSTFETGARLFVEVDADCCILFPAQEEVSHP